MKNKLVAIFILCVAIFASAESPSVGEPAAHEHRGFYSNMSFAFAYNWFKNSRVDLGGASFEIGGGYIDGKRRYVDYYDYNGFTFPMSEFKFGVGIANLAAVHFVFNIGFFAGSLDYNYEVYESLCAFGKTCPETIDESRNINNKSRNAYSFRTFFGLGSTFYPIQNKKSPLNGLFVGGSVGYTLFATMINSCNEDATGNGGVSFQLELGKEWWISDRVSIGFGLGFAHTGLIWKTLDSHSSDNVLSLSFRLTHG